MDIEYRFTETPDSRQLNSVLRDGKAVIGRCSISEEDKVWTISAWYVDKEYQNRGIGRKLLFDTCEELEKRIGAPAEIQYNWNGTNTYVFDWLSENFSPLSLCPMSVLKYEDIYPADIPEGHLYKLKKEQFIQYWKRYLAEAKMMFGKEK